MWVDDNQINTILTLLWRASWQAALLTGLVLLLQLIFKNRLTARLRYNLWLIVLLRLLLPVLPQSPLSIYNLLALNPPTPTPTATFAPPPIPLADIIDEEWIIEPDVTPFPAQQPGPHPIDAGAILSAPPPPPAAQRFRWRQALLIIWLFGLLLLVTRILIATIKLHRLVRRLDLVTDPHVLTLLDDCKRDLRVSHHVTILSSDQIPAPALLGFIKPRLLLPAHLLADFDPRELRLILMHELAHVRRRDVAVNWLATLLHALHWFNPVLWLALNRMRTDRELATDELVLAASRPDDRHLYGQTILKLLQQTLSRRTVLPGMVGILEGTHPLRRRITMIAQFKDRKPWSALALVALIALAAVTLTGPVRGQDAPTDDDQRENNPLTSDDRAATGEASATDDSALRDPTAQTTRSRDARQRLRDRRAAEVDPGGYGAGRFGRGGQGMAAWDAPAGTPAGRQDPAMTPAMRAIFEREIPEVRFDEIPFGDVIDFLRDVTGANIFVNWRSLESVGIERNAPVHMRMKNVSFATVLRLLLDSTAPGLLQYDTDGGVIIIFADPAAAAPHSPFASGPGGMVSIVGMGDMPGAGAPATPASAIPSAVTRVYDVRDLVAASSTAASADVPSSNDIRNQIAQLRAEIERMSERLAPDHPERKRLDAMELALIQRLGTRAPDPNSRAARLDELVSIIQETIGQEQPLNVRGFNTKLIVRAAPETQTEVQSLLKMLREDNADATPRETPARR